MFQRKETIRTLRKKKNTLIQIANEFKSFKKLTRIVFNKKYGNPYLLHYSRKATSLITQHKWEIPTQFQLNVISGFVNNKRSHYNSYFKEQQIFISDVEYLFKSHTMIENHVKIYASYKYNVTIIPNFYPQGKEVMLIVNNYHKDIKKYEFQGRKAYFRYTYTPATVIVNTVVENENENEKEKQQSLSSFVSKDKSNVNNMNMFLYLDDNNKEEELNMTINKNNSNFFNESLLAKINVKSGNNSDDSLSKIKIKKDKGHRDIRAHHNSLDSIEDLIEDIKLIEEDKTKLLPTRKDHNLQMNAKKLKLQIKKNLLLTTLRNELQQTNIRNDYNHHKFKTRKEKFNIDLMNKLHHFTNKNHIRSESECNNNNKNNFTINSFYKDAEHFAYGKVYSTYKHEKKKNMVTSVLLEYNKNRIAKEKEIKKEQFFKTQKQITKPKVICLQTERRIQSDWLKYKDSNNNNKFYKGGSNSRTISHRYCETLDTEMFYCKTHGSIINPNEDKETYKIENKTKRLMFKLKKRNEKMKEHVDKNYRTIPGKRISMMTMACRPDIYDNYGMTRKRFIFKG